MAANSPVPRRLWIGAQSDDLRHCLESLLALLLLDDANEPLYVFLAELVDGQVIENDFGQFDGLLPRLAGERAVMLSNVIRELGGRRPVRIAAPRSQRATAFALAVRDVAQVRLGLDRPAVLGIAERYYDLAGAIRMTARGIEAVGGPVTYSHGERGSEERRARLAEMERIWTLLPEGSLP